VIRAAAEGERGRLLYPPLVVTADDIREAFAAIADALHVVAVGE
jgi:hypothetical protein